MPEGFSSRNLISTHNYFSKVSHLTRILATPDRTDETAGTCAAEVTSATALDALLATLPAAPVTSPTTLDTTLEALEATPDTAEPTADVSDASTEVTPPTSDETTDGNADVSLPASDRLILLAMLSISDKLNERLYVVGTCDWLSFSHGIEYPPTPISTVSAAAISNSPSGMIPSDASAPCVSRTLPKVPLFALP